jgi:uncharacterized damage-inducible protein DinB
MCETLASMFAHLRWADERMIQTLRTLAAPPPKAIELYAHVAGAEAVWLARLDGKDAPVTVWPELDLEQCAVLLEQTGAALAAKAASVDEDELSRVVDYRNSAGIELHSTAREILVQVAMHGQYHRGQVNLLLRQSGHDPAAIDYITFVRGVPAATKRQG